MRGREPLVVWLLFAAVAVEIVVTYSRLPPAELYHVSGSGLAGASRALVFLNFPTALAAIGIAAILLDRLPSLGLRVLALVAVLLCTPVFWPGVVDQADLDARWINVPAALGVALAVALTFAAQVDRGPPLRGDRVRIAIAALALLAAPPWIAAELGFFLNGVPLLCRIYETGPRFVHHGHHHGMDGVLLTVAALLLSRALPAIRGRGLRLVTAAYLALMLAYGLGNLVNDFWLEQFVKRGWTSWAIPSVLLPRASWAWLVLLAGAAAIWAAWFRRAAAAPQAPPGRSSSAGAPP